MCNDVAFCKVVWCHVIIYVAFHGVVLCGVVRCYIVTRKICCNSTLLHGIWCIVLGHGYHVYIVAQYASV